MLKHIPPVISPELLKILAEMGHGDELVIADGNFPASAMAKRLVRADGHAGTVLLDAVLELVPLDADSQNPLALMDNGDPANPPPIWKDYRAIAQKHAGNVGFTQLERYAFYERAKQAYAIVATGELALYANIIIRKGVVTL